MKKVVVFIIIIAIILLALFLTSQKITDITTPSIEFENTEYSFTPNDLSSYQKSRIAHGGGALDDYTYSNSYNVVKHYYGKGLRLFELDVEYTSDNMPVMLHSWDGFQFKYLGIDRDKICTYDEFLNATMINGWTQLTLDSTISMMKNEFPEMILITDTKENNKDLLLTLSTAYKEMIDRIIPQVYSRYEYKYAKDLGFKNIIYTLYMSEDTDEQICCFCKEEKPFAITMPKARALESDLARRLNDIGTYVYAHTINEKEEFKELKRNGVQGIYTDILM